MNGVEAQVLVSLSYQVIPGKQRLFERGIEKVIALMNSTPDHIQTEQYKLLNSEVNYLVISEWSVASKALSFFRGEDFRRATGWGSTQVVSTRPTMKILTVFGSPSLSAIGPGLP